VSKAEPGDADESGLMSEWTLSYSALEKGEPLERLKRGRGDREKGTSLIKEVG